MCLNVATLLKIPLGAKERFRSSGSSAFQDSVTEASTDGKLADRLPERQSCWVLQQESYPQTLTFWLASPRGVRRHSDVDLLVEFDPDRIPGLIRLAGMEIELTRLLGRKADLRTPQDLRGLIAELERVIEPEE